MPTINWRSNYKLPLSFIVFFVLMFFLIGEQLTALPIYLFGPGVGESGPDKVHILDLALGDGLLHRPFAYLIIGTVIWGLFRIFSWPLAWTIGAALWAVEQLTLTPLDQRPSIPNIIIFTSTAWIILTLVPYFIYRWVDKKWAGVGKRNAILVTAAINILLFLFFAYQIFYLHNSYRGLHKNTGQQGVSSRVLPQNTCPQRLITQKDKLTVCPEALAKSDLDFTPDPGVRIHNASNPGIYQDQNGLFYLYFRDRLATSKDGLHFSQSHHYLGPKIPRAFW